MKHLLGITSIAGIVYGINEGRWAFIVGGVLVGFYAIAIAASQETK